MTNNKRKGFTIVELVIVIAVIAILAGVLIPTFASIIDKANQSSDIQAVRQMNVVLMAESVENEPTGIDDVINIVSEAGYDTPEKRTPKSSDHGFYWHSDTNTIVLVKDPANETAELIYPQDNQDLTTAFDALKASWTNDHTGFEDLAVEGGNSGGGTVITKLSELKDALTIGGEIKLGADIIINEPITISSDVTIDLNGNTLTLEDPSTETISDPVVTVSGTLKIIDNSEESGEIIIKKPTNEDIADMACGIKVNTGGTLDLDKVTVTADRLWNIENYANLSFTNSKLVVTGGYGIANAGEAIIENCELVANGEGVTQVYTSGGTTSIINTELYEGTGFESYNYWSPIEALDGCVITLGSGTTVTTSVKKDDETDLIYSAQVSNGGKIIVNGATIGYKISCTGEGSSITIYSGTINVAEFAGGTITINRDESEGGTITINGDESADILEKEGKAYIFAGRYYGLVKGDGCWVIEDK